MMRIIAFGDIHMNPGNLTTVPGIKSADLILLSGDLTNFGGDDDAAQVLQSVGTLNSNILALAGNLDRPEVNKYLHNQGISLHGTGTTLNNLGIFGVGGSNPTPFKTPNEFSEPEITILLKQGFSKVAAADHHILVSHAPPYGTNCDRLPNHSHVGSQAIRAFIEEQQPALCLTGHIHEAKSIDRIGGTTIINPGMISQGGWIEIEFDGDTLTAQLKNRT